MMVSDKKELKFEELNSVAGGNAVGPFKETGPLGTGPLKEIGPLGTGPFNYPYEQKTGPLMPPPITKVPL